MYHLQIYLKFYSLKYFLAMKFSRDYSLTKNLYEKSEQSNKVVVSLFLFLS